MREASHFCPLCVRLQNFYPGSVMTVTVGNQSCSNVSDVTYTSLRCTAPPGPGFGDVQLVVTVVGSGAGGFPLHYNAPVVLALAGSPCDADVACPLQVRAQVFVVREPVVRHMGTTSSTSAPALVV